MVSVFSRSVMNMDMTVEYFIVKNFIGREMGKRVACDEEDWVWALKSLWPLLTSCCGMKICNLIGLWDRVDGTFFQEKKANSVRESTLQAFSSVWREFGKLAEKTSNLSEKIAISCHAFFRRTYQKLLQFGFFSIEHIRLGNSKAWKRRFRVRKDCIALKTTELLAFFVWCQASTNWIPKEKHSVWRTNIVVHWRWFLFTRSVLSNEPTCTIV